jgi:prevent-host-death family protein
MLRLSAAPTGYRLPIDQFSRRLFVPEIGAYDAKTHLPRLLQRVQKGERFVITKHGRPIAELVPVTRRDAESVQRAAANLRVLRDELARCGVRLRDLLQEDETLRDLAHEEHRY